MARSSIWRGVTAALGALVILSTLAVALAGCGGSPSGTNASKGTVSVAYAGSLVNLMEHTFGPDFTKTSGYGFQGQGAGSTALANQIKSKLISPDVFISASGKAYETLTGAANGDLADWHINFGATSIVIGYSPQSHFAAQLQAAANGTTPWYQVLQSSGMRIGRTDPKLDPKGIFTLYTMQLAQIYYKQADLSQKILGAPENTAQIFPEETLVARLTSGQLDAGFFYLNEAIDAHIPYITLPNQINLSQPNLKSYYAQASYTSASGKQTGGPIIYSVTILSTAKNEAGAVAFVQYLLGSAGQSILHAHGILQTAFTFTGDTSKVPAGLTQYAG